jgi:N-methylhydantoinase A
VIFDDPRAPQDTAIHRVERPAPGQVVEGPALVEYPGHTVVVPPGATARSDDHANLIITAEEGR